MNKVLPWVILILAILGAVYLWKMYGSKSGGGDAPGGTTSA